MRSFQTIWFSFDFKGLIYLKNEILDTKGMSIKEHVRFLVKRCIALPSKLVGFKSLCFFIATWLLCKGFITEWVWLCVLVIVLFGIVGLKVITNYKAKKTDE